VHAPVVRRGREDPESNDDHGGSWRPEKQATFDAASAYADIMLSSVTGVLDDVDPSVRHY
jgi:hypothetical protein